ncbi:hypothetical protein C1637_12405 [Chryseobacterium lactis]|uniref:Outer membrane protein beta-barrel domain-containing protein n=1 Tax=Chryseobacterium lactis TaxID=1241981 RepID=A0A3G6RRM1_CHRLC|nr:hypothetical protein [Chryseobacterium lactis]AZA80675.1 hypothetical protein EG342_01535 [Chryseobacterium lactis]AZB05677.1 hypothetical protein EG341_17660 [Chryseobacterium lactis]PNW13604.1 hypothetical protein C1637_12405 [Chryseobacterium lactis]
MKTKIVLLFLLGWMEVMWGQESFNLRYRIYNQLGEYNLKKKIMKRYDSLSENEQKKIRNKYKIGDKLSIEDKIIIQNKETKVIREIIIDEKFFKNYKIDTIVSANIGNMEHGNVRIDKNKLLVNLLLKCGKSSPAYFYELENRKSPSLPFTSVTVSAITIPIKYRFKGKDGLGEEFSTAINGNLFLGYTYGKSTFFYQEEIETKVNTWKVTGGLLFGASSVKLDKSNSDPVPIDDHSLPPEYVDATKGLASIAIGITYSYNNINVGAFFGFDYAIGQHADLWKYNKKPWLGIGIGYKLFSF